MSLTEFLLARIAEDEEVALMADTRWPDGVPGLMYDGMSLELVTSPARALAECAAKRRIVTAYTDVATTCDHMPWVNLGGCCQCGAVAHSLLAFAAVYADHEDFREEWKP